MNRLIISLFKGYADVCPIDVELETIVEMIRHDASTVQCTERHRYYLGQGLEKPASHEKAASPCFAVAVRFSGGKREEHICGWTSLCLADFDHIAPEMMEQCLRLIREDEHTLLAYTTISGRGIRVISAYAQGTQCAGLPERTLYRMAFNKMNLYYKNLIGMDFDEKCKNATRLSGLAHDPDVYYNPQAVPFVLDKEDDTQKRKRADKRLKRIVSEVERELDREGIAYEPHRHNEYIMRTGYLMNAYGVKQEAAIAWAGKRFADYDGDVEGIFRSCYKKTEEYGSRRLPVKSKNDDGESRLASAAEIESFLASKGSYRLNTVTGKCEFAPAGEEDFTDLTDRHVSTLWAQMDKEVKPLRISDLRTVLQSEFVPLYNPFRQYFDGLQPWDGVTDHIGQLAARVHVSHDADLFPRCFKKWLVAMVASLLDAEVVNHQILVLIGRQGIYKTTWLNNLLPPALRRYFYLKSDSRNISKDDVLTLAEFAVVCLEELDELDGRELNRLKALTTQRNVNERAAYAHFKEVRAHIASFCGTSNHVHILNDISGNRRWMPFEVDSIDSPYLHKVDYDGVYAQAYALLQGGFAYWLEGEEIEELSRHNCHYEVPCLEEELILTHYRRPLPGEEGIFVTSTDILARINAGLREKLSPVKIGVVMKRIGFEQIRVASKRGYRVVELTGEEIYRNRQALARYN